MTGSGAVPERVVESLWEAYAALSWVHKHVGLLVESGELTPADAEEIADHADEAEEHLFGPLAVVCSWLGKPGYEVDEDARLAAASAAIRLPIRNVSATRRVAREVMETALSRIVEALVDVSELAEAGELSVEHVMEFDEGLGSASEAVDAGLMALDPSRASEELRETEDPDTRIILASSQERAEMRRERVRATNAHFDALARASAKLTALGTSRRMEYAKLRGRLEAARSEHAAMLIADLQGLGLAPDEAEALVRMFLVDARLRD